MDEYKISEDFDWHDDDSGDAVELQCGIVVLAKEVYEAIEILTPILQRTKNRHPNEEEILTVILTIRGI